MTMFKKRMKDSYNRIASTFYRDSDKWTIHPDFQRIFHFLEENCPPEMTVLDLGCGPGTPFLKRFARHFETVIGVDLSPQMLIRAQQYVPEAKLVQADIGNLAFSENSFDVIACLYTLFHLPYDEQARLLDNMSQWIAPGGFVFLLFHAGESKRKDELGDWHGAPMSWFLQPSSWYEKLLSDAHFRQVCEFSTKETPLWYWKICLYQKEGNKRMTRRTESETR